MPAAPAEDDAQSMREQKDDMAYGMGKWRRAADGRLFEQQLASYARKTRGPVSVSPVTAHARLIKKGFSGQN
eukprot:8676778-Alexandrium_andersonii.AAC.1